VKTGLEALRGAKTINKIAWERGVHPTQVGQWKVEIQEQTKILFEGKRSSKPRATHQKPELLYSAIDKLKVELYWLKKVQDQSAMTRQAWIDKGWPAVSLVRQCALAGESSPTVYVQ
jgi:transposase